MMSNQTPEEQTLLSNELIDLQLKKIIADPAFNESEILKKFLTYIVNETVAGNSNCLKEYTIAVRVLGKSANFKPQENGIVRIHAGRLRRALAQYYETVGANDPIEISVPKWKYIPQFMDRIHGATNLEMDASQIQMPTVHALSPSVVAVLPFNCAESSPLCKSFSEGLCMQLCTALTAIDGVSVIAHQAIKPMSLNGDFREIAKSMGCNHIITGNIQSSKDKIRINVQVIQTSNYEQAWGELFESILTPKSIFLVQDEISSLVVSKFESHFLSIHSTESLDPVMAAI